MAAASCPRVIPGNTAESAPCAASGRTPRCGAPRPWAWPRRPGPWRVRPLQRRGHDARVQAGEDLAQRRARALHAGPAEASPSAVPRGRRHRYEAVAEPPGPRRCWQHREGVRLPPGELLARHRRRGPPRLERCAATRPAESVSRKGDEVARSQAHPRWSMSPGSSSSARPAAPGARRVRAAPTATAPARATTTRSPDHHRHGRPPPPGSGTPRSLHEALRRPPAHIAGSSHTSASTSADTAYFTPSIASSFASSRVGEDLHEQRVGVSAMVRRSTPGRRSSGRAPHHGGHGDRDRQPLQVDATAPPASAW
jgi:hypothetical protein